jgi:hypothetical protein
LPACLVVEAGPDLTALGLASPDRREDIHRAALMTHLSLCTIPLPSDRLRTARCASSMLPCIPELMLLPVPPTHVEFFRFTTGVPFLLEQSGRSVGWYQKSLCYFLAWMMR